MPADRIEHLVLNARLRAGGLEGVPPAVIGGDVATTVARWPLPPTVAIGTLVKNM